MSADPLTASLISDYNRGCDLRDAGRSDDALRVWAELVRSAGDGLSENAQLVVARALDAAAHLLRDSGRETEAADHAMQAVALARPLEGREAQLVLCRAVKTHVLALRGLGRDDKARQVEEDLIERSSSGDVFELRAFAAYALRYRLWEHMQRKDLVSAVASAQRVTDLLGQESNSDHLIEAGEVILSSAAVLNEHPIWRRPSPDAKVQARRMFELVGQMAESVGGNIGAAVAANARLAATGAHARELRPDVFFRERLNEPAIPESALPALQLVADMARAAGSEDRAYSLIMRRATTLSDLGQTEAAVRVMDQLITELSANDGIKSKGSLTLARAMRKLISTPE
jgi:hypothetical protein